MANLWFYARLGGAGWIVLSVVFLYTLVFWLMNCIYHFPLIIAADLGIVKRENGGPPRLTAVFRNALVLVLAAPIYSLALLLILTGIGVILAISGVGMAMLGSGFMAFLATRASRDHLTRFGALPPEPELDGPMANDAWRLRDL
jgi:hypothetical protein